MAVEGGSDQDAEGEPGPGTEGDQGRFNYCSLPPVVQRDFAPGLSGPRIEAILVNEHKWANGTTIRYYFFDRPTDGSTVTFSDGSRRFVPWTSDEAHKDLVREAFATPRKAVDIRTSTQTKDLGVIGVVLAVRVLPDTGVGVGERDDVVLREDAGDDPATDVRGEDLRVLRQLDDREHRHQRRGILWQDMAGEAVVEQHVV